MMTRHVPVLMLRKLMTEAGSPESEIRLATARAKQTNAGGALRVASVAGSTPAQIRRAMAAARIAAKKVTITTTTIVDDGEDDLEKPIDDDDDDVDGKDERKKPVESNTADGEDDVDGKDDDTDAKRPATLATLQRDVSKLRREATARAAGNSSREDQRAAEDAIWRKMRLDPAAVRASLAKRRASSQGPLGSPSHVRGPDADRRVIRDAAKRGTELSHEHVKMLRKMGHDDASIAAIAAKLAKGSR